MFKKQRQVISLLLAFIMLVAFPTNVAAMQQLPKPQETSVTQAVKDAYSGIKEGMGLPGLNGFEGDYELPEDSSPVSVIVMFKNQPAATLKAAAEIENNSRMSMRQAESVSENDHTSFRAGLDAMFSVDSLFSANNSAEEYEITSEYHNALNGVTITLPANRVEEMSKLESVYAVYPNKEVWLDKEEMSQFAPIAMGNPDGGKGGRDQMNADALHALGIKGQGVDILVIDTGVDYNHPALKDAFRTTSPSGEASDLKDGKFYGRNFVRNDYVTRADNDPLEATYDEMKALGAAPTMDGYDFATMHGTHVAGTAVARDVFNDDSGNGALGVAPEANLYVYRVFGAYSRSTDEAILNAIEYVAIDQPDIVNMSLGALVNSAEHIYALAVNNVMIQLPEILFVVAAGNSGEYGVFSLGSPSTSPTAISVANASAKVTNEEYQVRAPRSTNGNLSNANTYIRPLYMDMESSFELQTVQYTNPVTGVVTPMQVYVSNHPNLKLHTEGPLQGKYKFAIVLDASMPYPEVGVGTAADFEYTISKYGEDFFEGSVVLVRRGQDFKETSQRAESYGAGAVLLINHSNFNGDPSGIETSRGRNADYLPFFVIEFDSWGSSFSEYPAPGGDYLTYNGYGIILSGKRTTSTNPSLDPTSSRGPVGLTYDIKPDVASHGAVVLSTIPLLDESYAPDYSDAYAYASGTSMASPHVAGAAALLRCAFSDMTAEEIKVRLMNSSKVMDISWGSIDARYGVYEQGAGLVDVLAAYNAESYVSVGYDNVSIPTTDLNIAKASRDTGSFNFGRIGIKEEIPTVEKRLTGKITNTSNAAKQFSLDSIFNYRGALVIDIMQDYGWDIVAEATFEYNGVAFNIYSDKITVQPGETEEFTLILTVHSDLLLKHEIYSGSIEGYVTVSEGGSVYSLPFAVYTVLDKPPIEMGFLNRPVISTSETNSQTEYSAKADFFFSMNKPAQLNFALLDPDKYDRNMVVDGLISLEDLTSDKLLLGSLETSFIMEYITPGDIYIQNSILNDGRYYPFTDYVDNWPTGVAYPEELPRMKEGLNALLVEAYTFESEVYYYVFEFYVDNTPAVITLENGDVDGQYGSVPATETADSLVISGTVYDYEADIMNSLGMKYEIWEEGDELGQTPDQSFTVLFAEVDGKMYEADVDPQTGAFTVEIPKIATPSNILLYAVDGYSIMSFLDSLGNHSTPVADGFSPNRPGYREKYLLQQSENYGFVGSNLEIMLVTVGQEGAAFTLSNDNPGLFIGEELVLDVLFNGEALSLGDAVESVFIADELYALAEVSGNEIIVTGLREGVTELTVVTVNGLSRTFELNVNIKFSEGVNLSAGSEVYYGATKHLSNYDPTRTANGVLRAPVASNYETQATPIIWTVMGTEILPDSSEGNLSLLSKHVIDVLKFTEDGFAKYFERDKTIRHYMNGGDWFTYDWVQNEYTIHHEEAEFQKNFTEAELASVPPVTNQVYAMVNGDVAPSVSSISFGDKFFLPWSALDTEGYASTLRILYSIYWSAGSGLDQANSLAYRKQISQLYNDPNLIATLKNSSTTVPYWTETPTDLTRLTIIPEKDAMMNEQGETAWNYCGFRPGTTLDLDRVIYAAEDAQGINKLTLVSETPESIGVISGDLSTADHAVEPGANLEVDADIIGEGYDSVVYKLMDENGAIIRYGITDKQDIVSGKLAFETDDLSIGEYKIVVWPQKTNEQNSNEAGQPAVMYLSVNELVDITVTAAGNGTVEGAGQYPAGGNVTLTAVPADECNTFIGWYENDELVSEANPYVFTAEADRTLVAKFAECADIVSAKVNLSAITNLKKGSTMQAVALITYADGVPCPVTLEWKSSNNNIASIDSNGLITAKSAGMIVMTLTVRSAFGTVKTVPFSIKVS